MTLSLEINQCELAAKVGGLPDRELTDFLFDVAKIRYRALGRSDAFTEAVAKWFVDGIPGVEKRSK